MDVKRPVIVSMTSWKQRIKYVAKTIFEMTRQTLLPEKIYLTLSTDEFPTKEAELPLELIILSKTLPNFEINWVKENTKAFKKLIPVLHKYKDKDVWIITVDDDIFYSEQYIEYLAGMAETHFNSVINPRLAGNWLHGAFGCYHPTYFKDKIFKITTREMIAFVEDDKWYMACYRSNGIKDFPDCNLKNYVKLERYESPLSKIYLSRATKARSTQLISEILKR